MFIFYVTYNEFYEVAFLEETVQSLYLKIYWQGYYCSAQMTGTLVPYSFLLNTTINPGNNARVKQREA